jgi:hypothetical protein
MNAKQVEEEHRKVENLQSPYRETASLWMSLGGGPASLFKSSTYILVDLKRLAGTPPV